MVSQPSDIILGLCRDAVDEGLMRGVHATSELEVLPDEYAKLWAESTSKELYSNVSDKAHLHKCHRTHLARTPRCPKASPCSGSRLSEA